MIFSFRRPLKLNLYPQKVYQLLKIIATNASTHGKCGGELRKVSGVKGNRRTRNFPLLFPASPSAPLELDKLCGQPLKASPIHTPLFA